MLLSDWFCHHSDKGQGLPAREASLRYEVKGCLSDARVGIIIILCKTQAATFYRAYVASYCEPAFMHADYIRVYLLFLSLDADFSTSLTADAMVLAGSSHTLMCQGVRGKDQTAGTTLEVEWFDPNNQAITTETSGVIITGVTSVTNNATLVSYLTFPALTTSQAGPYTCRLNHTIPDTTIMDQSLERISTVRVESKCRLL